MLLNSYKKNLKINPRSIFKEIIIGVIPSILAVILIQIIGKIYHFENRLLLILSNILFLIIAIAIFLFFRMRRFAAPGLIGWLADRRDNKYFEKLVEHAERSIEIMGCTGSSVFVQGGKLLNILKSKYETNIKLKTKVILVNPKAYNLIKYRQKKLGNEPNVLSSEDILSTIRILHDAYKQFVYPSQFLEVRTYFNELVWHIAIIDRHFALLGFYGPSKSGWKWPVLIFEKKANSFYYAIEEQFDQRWSSSDLIKF